jgi:hypothetical protein
MGGIRTLREAAEKNPVAKEALSSAVSHALLDVRVLSASNLVELDPSAADQYVISALGEGLSSKDRLLRERTQAG